MRLNRLLLTILGSGGTVGEPTITLSGNGNAITNGDTSPSVADNTDFSLNRVGVTKTLDFLISNPGGTANLTIRNITVPSGFTITAEPVSVGIDDSETLSIRADVATEATFSGTVSIEHNGAESPFEFDIRAVSIEISHLWHLDESSSGAGAVTRNDSIGTIHLTDINTCLSGAGLSSNTGNAALFNRDNSERLQNASPTGLDNQSEFTFAGWARLDAKPANMGLFGIQNQFRLLWNNTVGRFEWLIYPNTSTPVATVNGAVVALDIGEWFYFECGVKTGGAHGTAFLRIGIDGEGSELTQALSAAAVVNANQFQLGTRGDSDNFLTGALDEVIRKEGTLSAAQRTAFYNGGNGVSL